MAKLLNQDFFNKGVFVKFKLLFYETKSGLFGSAIFD